MQQPGVTPNTPDDDDALVAGLPVGAGLPPRPAGLSACFGAALRGGHLDQQSTVLEDLTGRPPRPVAEVWTAGLSTRQPVAPPGTDGRPGRPRDGGGPQAP